MAPSTIYVNPYSPALTKIARTSKYQDVSTLEYLINSHSFFSQF